MAKGATATEADYDKVISKVFNDLVAKSGKKTTYAFVKDDLVDAMELLKKRGDVKHIRNIADIKYTYDARKDFPSAISKTGFWGIVGRGKGKYSFEKIAQNNLIRIPKDISSLTVSNAKVKDATPDAVDAVLGNDEQATMTRLRYSDILSHFLGMESFQVQGHERTTVKHVGQIEVDEIYVARSAKKKFIIPISGKGGDKDCLSYTQALNLSLYAKEKKRFEGLEAIPLGILRGTSGHVYIVRFNNATELRAVKIEQVAVYEFEKRVSPT